MFILNSDITIGKFRFSGVNDVRIERSLHNVTDTAIIRIPSIARIVKNGNRAPGNVITADQFKEGDPVSIDLGYNGELRMEFKGFVKRKSLGMPLDVICEGYSWLLRRNIVNISKTAVAIKDLLHLAVAGIDSRYPIRVKCTIDMVLNNVQVNGTGLDVIDAIAKYTDGTVHCFFSQPDELWCGLIYTPYANGNDALSAGEVKYKLGYNVLKANTLKQRTIRDDKVEVKYSKRLSSGTQLSQSSDAFREFARTHSRVLNQLKDAAALKTLANEKAYKMNYTGYEGTINTFLDPYAAPGYKVYITDSRYPERNGTYIIENVATRFGVTGARRTIEIGPQIGFAKKQ